MSPTEPQALTPLSHLAARLLLEAPVGAEVALPRAGSVLENAHVYDAVARELLRHAGTGRVQIVSHDLAGGLVRNLVFRRAS